MTINLYPNNSFHSLVQATFYPSWTFNFFSISKEKKAQWNLAQKAFYFAAVFIPAVVSCIFETVFSCFYFVIINRISNLTLPQRYKIIKNFAKLQNFDMSDEKVLGLAKKTAYFKQSELQKAVFLTMKVSASEENQLLELCSKRRQKYIKYHKEDQKITSIHECGHAIVILKKMGSVLKLRDIRIEPSIPYKDAICYLGINNINWACGQWDYYACKNDVGMYFAGRAAEAVFGYEKDYNLRKMLKENTADNAYAQYYKKQCLCWGDRAYKHPICNATNFSIFKGVVSKIKQTVAKFLGFKSECEADMEFLSSIFEDTKRLIVENKERVEEMATYLMEYELLSREDINRIESSLFNKEQKDKELITAFNATMFRPKKHFFCQAQKSLA